MPEYGRHVQKMVDFALSVEDRDRRNMLAYTIVRTMQGLVPELSETNGGEQVYWDHLAIISGFRLDVDYPEGTVTQEQFEQPIEKPSYTTHRIHYRYYGYLIEGMIKRICAMPMGRERAELEYFVALQMKRGYMTWNSEIVEDLKIFKDLYELSEGQIMLTPENCKLSINPNSIDKGGKQKVSRKMMLGVAKAMPKPVSRVVKRK